MPVMSASSDAGGKEGACVDSDEMFSLLWMNSGSFQSLTALFITAVDD